MMSQCKFRCWSVYNNNSNNELAMGANSQLKGKGVKGGVAGVPPFCAWAVHETIRGN